MNAIPNRSRVGEFLATLTPPQQLVALARTLHTEGYNDHTTGHITFKQPDGTFLVNPVELTWAELRVSDLMVMNQDGEAISGKHSITPAITLHRVLHRSRPEIVVALHGHPHWSTVWAATHQAPPIYDQTSALAGRHLAIFSEYDGVVEETSNAERAVRAIGGMHLALLANHGVLMVAESILHAYFWASTLEWRSRRAWEVSQLGGGIPLKDSVVDQLHDYVLANIHLLPQFEAAIREEIRRDPTLFD